MKSESAQPRKQPVRKKKGGRERRRKTRRGGGVFCRNRSKAGREGRGKANPLKIPQVSVTLRQEEKKKKRKGKGETHGLQNPLLPGE